MTPLPTIKRRLRMFINLRFANLLLYNLAQVGAAVWQEGSWAHIWERIDDVLASDAGAYCISMV